MNTDRLAMQSPDLADEKFRTLCALFPQAVTEAKDAEGNTVRAIDADVLRQEISTHVVSGPQERYRFTWPDKRAAQRLANSPTTQCLRPCREESVDFDSTQNLYIEGDNLEVLKILRESYLGKVKMIYIDPPYNTGNDFVYEDDFALTGSEYKEMSGEWDEHGNRLVQNTKGNGRFHTDWLNMIYPRLMIAKELLSEDGAIFVSLDDNELYNFHVAMQRVFGESMHVATFPWRKRTAKSDVPFGISQDYEWIVCYAKSSEFMASVEGGTKKYYETADFPGEEWRIHDLTTQRNASERPNSFFDMVNPKTGCSYPANPNRTWAVTKETFEEYYKANKIIFPGDYDFLNISRPVFRYWKRDDMAKAGESWGKIAVSTKLPDNIGMSQEGTKTVSELLNAKVFSYPKPVSLLQYFVQVCTGNSDLILDFFSGSATTAHAVMKLNAEDGGKRKFIMVQLPEETDEKSEAYKAGYKTICEIGKERIRRAAKKIREENPGAEFDGGFRVLKCDSSNMEDAYYTPEQIILDKDRLFTELVKEDRSGEDLLFQVMPEYNIPLSESIEKLSICGKTAYDVGHGYLLACFDIGLTEEHIRAMAARQPVHFVTLDRSLATDAMVHNLGELFRQLSPNTTSCKTL